MMKRGRESEEMESIDMAKLLILMSQRLHYKPKIDQKLSDVNEFACKTCNRKFSSFQALGGHRASHKRPKISMGDKPISDQAESLSLGLATTSTSHVKRKIHECSICGQEFSLGQALGGHMRRHRAAINGDTSAVSVFPVLTGGPAVLKRSNSSKRVHVWLDLNLTPLENDLEFIFGKNMAPKVDHRLII
ncbi:zinc finger protein ZAT11-like [Carica papaya]|uniref:zinc finger protein ZAT11-like n=1 Tax=Carica papaya TaxID=3649 RepID=UPI000B8C806A|nr:zinc finger protein ZAT11-like [Carica papaya]